MPHPCAYPHVLWPPPHSPIRRSAASWAPRSASARRARSTRWAAVCSAAGTVTGVGWRWHVAAPLVVAPMTATPAASPHRSVHGTPSQPVSSNQQFRPLPPPCRACGRFPCTRRRRARPCTAWAVSDACAVLSASGFVAGLDRAGCCCSRSVPQDCAPAPPPAADVLTSHSALAHAARQLPAENLSVEPLHAIPHLHALPHCQRPSFLSDPPATPHSHPLQAWATLRRACPPSVT